MRFSKPASVLPCRRLPCAWILPCGRSSLPPRQKGEHIAMLEARRHVNCYLKQQSGLKTFKNRICALERLEQLYEIVEELKQTVSEE